MSNLQTPYACSICKKEFHITISLVKHVEWRHAKATKSSKKAQENANSYSNSDILGHSSSSEIQESSSISQRKIVTNNNESSHQSSFNTLKTNNDLTRNSNNLSTKDIIETVAANDDFSCQLCHKSFLNKFQLNNHEKIHIAKYFTFSQMESNDTITFSKYFNVSASENDTADVQDVKELNDQEIHEADYSHQNSLEILKNKQYYTSSYINKI